MNQVLHHGPAASGGAPHQGPREGCSRFECLWPRQGGRTFSAMTDGGERTGKLVDFNVIQTSPGNEYPIIRSTMRKPDWGTYCPHGLKVVERVPTEHSCQSRESLPGATAWDWDEPVPCTGCYPDGQIVEPWPCDAPDCTRERFDLAMEAEVEEYWESISQLISQQYD